MGAIPFWQVDAFTSRVLHGNPAAVCVLDAWLPDEVLQQIAAEHNLSETAFLVANASGGYALRWMTPVAEVDLCGHATLASGWVVLHELQPEASKVVFETRSGPLSVEREGDGFGMDFPAQPGEACNAPDGLEAALGARPQELFENGTNFMAVLASAQQVWSLEPNFAALAGLSQRMIATAPGDDEVDFVSRYFAPAVGVPEDAVTGSSHCMLAPYWAARLGKNPLHARQISPRGGDLHCEVRGDRVHLVGDAVLFAKGELHLA